MTMMEVAAVDAHSLREWQTRLFRETRAAVRPLVRLMPAIVDRRNLLAAWERVSSADGARTPGPDGVHCLEIQNQLEPWLNRIIEDLSRRRYTPQAPRWIDIPRPNEPNRPRRLGILTVRDRVVQTALKQALEPVLEPIFLPSSFGFRPGRSVAAALNDGLDLLVDPRDGAPLHSVAHADVDDCFGTIDHVALREELRRHIADNDLLALIDDILESGGTSSGRLWWKRTCGVVQGSALSPLLCNLALHPIDEALLELSRSTGGAVRVLRYADDLLFLGADVRQTTRALDQARALLKKRFQTLSDGGVRSIASGISWLGVVIRPRANGWGGPPTFGYDIPDSKVADMLRRLSEMTVPPNEKIDGSAFNLSRWVVSINAQLREWRQAYLFADNAPQVFRALDDHTRSRVAALISSVTGERPGAVARKYRAKLERGFWTWEVPGARLVVLSSLAPHAPSALIRRPAWMQPDKRPQPAKKPRKPKPKTTPVKKPNPSPGWEAD